jgi:hypothetical protein
MIMSLITLRRSRQRAESQYKLSRNALSGIICRRPFSHCRRQKPSVASRLAKYRADLRNTSPGRRHLIPGRETQTAAARARYRGYRVWFPSFPEMISR